MIKVNVSIRWFCRFFAVTIAIGSMHTVYSSPTTVSWMSTTQQNPWVDKGTMPLTAWDSDTTCYISIDETTTFQQIDGWGGAINGRGWVALSVLSDAGRNAVLKALFDTSGCGIDLGRISMGANDYSVTMYSCSETPGDYEMNHFSLAHDKVNVIPFARAAKAVNPDIMFWGSPHSPPAWMKQNNSLIDGSLKTDDSTLSAYALYFQKWIEGMGAEGVPIYAVHIQNEPNITGNGYPACLMSGAEMGTLIKKYIGPQLKKSGLSTEVWVGTLHSANPGFTSFYPEYIPPTLGDPEANPFITGVGMQWGALNYAHQVVENYPSVKMMQTETQCGNYHWLPDYNPTAAPNDWGYGVFTLYRIMLWLRQGVNSYCQWNMVLDEIGLSNSITVPWPQNSMVSINKTTKEVRYNPQFYAVKHFSHYVKRGARRIATYGNYGVGGSNLLSTNIGESVTDGDMMAFKNVNGDRVLVVRNSSNADITVNVRLDAQHFTPTIPANSLNTFLIEDPVAVDYVKPVAKEIRQVVVRTIETSVELTVPAVAGGAVSCVVADPSGRVVTTIRESARHGRCVVVWDRSNNYGGKVSSGVYIARITADNKSYTATFTLQ